MQDTTRAEIEAIADAADCDPFDMLLAAWNEIHRERSDGLPGYPYGRDEPTPTPIGRRLDRYVAASTPQVRPRPPLWE